MPSKRPLSWIGLLIVGASALLILAVLFGIGRPAIEKHLAQNATSPPTRHPTAVPPTKTPEPLIPTHTPTKMTTATDTPTPSAEPIETTETGPTATDAPPTPIPSPSPSPIHTVAPPSTDLWQSRARWGVGVATGSIEHYNVEPLRLGWYVDWNTNPSPARPGGVVYVQMLRLRGGGLSPDVETIATIARANPGSLWLVGNEPDVKWQDNTEPATYARLYHEAYTAIKAADPTAQVASGGVAQPTPLRMRYLDASLTAYRDQFGTEMPMDIWNIHNFILREERGSWGVDIPPGLPDDRGMLYEVDDNDNIEIFRQQIVDFRRWMAERGYQDYPLIVSEYGIPMPEDYGFPPERVVSFLKGTFDFFSTAQDPALGYPQDSYRLVQRWCWYSLDAPDDYYPQGRLFDPSTKQLTAIGQGWVEYVREH